MHTLGIRPQPALAGLLLRLGLTFVLFTWAYDFHFNPVYYAHVLHGQAVPITLLLLGLGLAFIVGRATRVAAVVAAATFAVFAVALEGHQPVGLPQNAGLAAGALALGILGPGKLAPVSARRALTPRDLLLAGTILRTGLALTFFLYGVFKFSHADEYRIVVAQVPVISSLAHALGAPATVNVVGIFELLLAFLMLPGVATLWGAILQAVALSSFVATLGYPFSFPQDLGLIALIGGLVCTQSVRLPVAVRRDGRHRWRVQLALDQRPLRARAHERGAVLVLRLEGLADLGGEAAERARADLRAAAQRATRPSDICARAADDAYCVILPTLTTPDAVDLVVRRVRRQLGVDVLPHLPRGPLPLAIGAAHWGPGVTLSEALALAEARAAAPAAALAPAA